MDDFNSCLLQILRFCIEANLFLHQLYQFECHLTKIDSLYHISSDDYFTILECLSMIINDLNIYHRNYFQKLYLNIEKYLLRQYFTINYSSEELFHEDFEHLKYFLCHEIKSFQRIFHYLHKLSINCILCQQYRRLCTNIELEKRFSCIRMDLLMNLETVNRKIEVLLLKINMNFERKHENHQMKERIIITNLFRTICFWFIIIFSFGYYLQQFFVTKNTSKTIWYF
ncbi:hypothetical protein I4U23_030778 [Adineta vaga]|nr:hypothetical protein I4U23_030778 [Adineta vaga]